MTDYIKAGVELADGWSYMSDRSKPGSFWIKADGPPKHPGCHIDNAFPVYIDALAAQLVRQVDAMSGVTIDMRDAVVSIEIFEGGYWIEQCGVDGLWYEIDRTMNTIKAIVDSGVLTRPVPSEDD